MSVDTTELSIEIIDIISDRDGARLRDIVEEVDVAKSTAHKHLTTLRDNGFLVKRGEIYQVGLRFLNYGEQARSRWPGYPHIEEAIADLTERTEEECDFVAPDRGRIITIAESYHKWAKFGDTTTDGPSKEYRARTGSYYHMHATASGLAVLSTYARSRVEEVIERWGLPARTDHTITSREELHAELERIRERGYAVDDQGYTDGMRSVGKAVHGPEGDVIGALSVSGPTYRVDGMVLEQEVPNALRDVVADLEERLRTTS
ncbi:IclR family transcriptional regulator [Haloarcula amylolytica]|uniref:Transcription regulator n=1 Tax=Haloarcula amylolytica JCM 13557 TaxID=1227452 RepID=M0KAH6_9EURY|nr:IclR family transcriptional regulator [Haloarcula amylolytica]EMA17803.1 transcription regulator [Haloarcula amylolytica JCM 13557]